MKTICQVCIHNCALAPGQTGLCGARKNEGGEIICDNYGRITSIALDPIEKKPLQRMKDRKATDVNQLYRLARTAGRYLEKVYVGNV